jgi:hypothetical protein
MTLRRMPPVASAPRKPLSRKRLAGFALCFVALGQQALWHLGDLALAIVVGREAREWVFAAGILVLLFVAILLASFFWARRRPTPHENRLLALAMATVVIAGFLVLQSLVSLFLPVASFHGLYTWRLRSLREPSTTRPRVLYSYNSSGFRGPEWSSTREPGTTRVALIGDSFVFGSGVEAGDTLDRALAGRLFEISPSRRFEVLNLGLAGNNIASHVKLYEVAQQHLEVDAAVICLHLPNDLSRTEPAEEIRALVRPSAHGLATYLFGFSWVRLVSDLLWLDRDVTADGAAYLDQQLEEVSRFRADHPQTHVLLFAFDALDPRLLAALGRHPDLPLIPAAPAQQDERYFIRGDGHPNAEGNLLFARALAAAVSEVTARP